MKQIVAAVSIVVIFAMAPIVSAQPVICRYAAAKGLGDFASKAAFSELQLGEQCSFSVQQVGEMMCKDGATSWKNSRPPDNLRRNQGS